MLNFWDYSWPLIVDQCPCDVHFVEWLEDAAIRDATIFHFGTGEHHIVAVHGADRDTGNAVLGITASKNEYQTFIDLVIERPDVARLYNVMFGDIYLLNERLLPEFDIVTLFHLCEFWSEKNDAYGGMTDREMAELLIRRLKPGGRVLFYPGSFAFEKARPIIADLVRDGMLAPAGSFKTLEIYTREA